MLITSLVLVSAGIVTDITFSLSRRIAKTSFIQLIRYDDRQIAHTTQTAIVIHVFLFLTKYAAILTAISFSFPFIPFIGSLLRTAPCSDACS